MKPDALAHLADALMEDIIAAPPHQLAIEEIVDAGRSRKLVFRFDDILADAAAPSAERPASRHGSAMWNLTDALCEDLAAQPDDARPGDASDDRTGRGSLAVQFDDIIRRDSHLTRAGLTLPARRHPTLSVKAMLATLRDRLLAPLHSRSAAGAFATVVTAAVLTAVVYQPSRWTVDDQPLPPAAERERIAAALPESPAASAAPPAAARVESLPAPAPTDGGSVADMAKPAEALPPPPVIAADIGERHVAAARMRAATPPHGAASAPPAAPAQSGVASQVDVASQADASPPVAAAPPAVVSAPAPARKQRFEADVPPGGRAAETARAASRRGRLDGPRTPPDIPSISVPPAIPLGTPGQLSAWWAATQSGDVETRVKALEDAARNGDVVAAWKLGRIYADGDGVQQDHLRAFGYFRGITEDDATSSAGYAGGPTARFVAGAFVEVGRYYLTGIANSDVKPDPVRAVEMFTHAATMGDADAQYHLGRMYLDGEGVAKDPMQGARWLYQAAMKGQYLAQAMFGRLLFKGEGVPREAAKGLMWIRIAADAAPAGETAIAELYDAALKQATDEERAAAAVYYEQWRQRGRGDFRSGSETR